MGALAEDSDTAETEAMIWATLWSLQNSVAHAKNACTIVSDSMTKTMAAMGQWKAPDTPQGLVLQNLTRAAQMKVGLQHEWTRSHQGELFNELADHCAKCAARFSETTPKSTDYHIMEFGDALDWLWVSFVTDDQHGVRTEGNHLRFLCPEALQNTAFFESRQVTQERKPVTLTLKVASFNINTLKGKTAGMHREAVLLRHAKENCINILGLQETRRKQTKEWQRGEYFGFSSAAQAGQGGIDIIFRRNAPFAWLQGAALCLDPAMCTVVFAEPQAMMVQIKTDGITLAVLSAHAPHDGASEEQKETFWDALMSKVKKMNAPVIVLIDANAKMGQQTMQGIGTAFAETANSNTPYFVNLIEVNHLWLPSTDERTITSPTQEQGTWHHRGGLSRIDFVALPFDWKQGCVTTDVQDVEFAQTFKDHRLVLANVEVTMEVVIAHKQKSKQPDRNAMTTPYGQWTVQWLADNFVPFSSEGKPLASDELIWQYETYMKEQLLLWFPKQEKAMRPSWITDEAWQALKEVKHLRRYTRDSRKWEKRAIMRQILHSWKDATTPKPSPNWLKLVHLQRAWAQWRIERMCTKTHELLQRDEAAFLQWCQDQFETRCHDANATDLWKVIKRHLPKMKDKESSRAMRFTKAQATFEEHFAENEKAKQMDDSTLQECLAAQSRQAIIKSQEISFEIRHLPTLREFEQAIRKSKPGKACFGYAYPEWMLAAPRQTALTLFAALKDHFVFFQEPACLKGGQYFPLWKKKGPQDDPASYRAILLSSFIGKAFHHILRQRLVRHFPNVMVGMQIGGLPRQRVQYGSHTLSLMRHHAVRRGMSHAVVFFDLTAAFYHVPKHLVVDDVLGYGRNHEDEDEISILPLLQASATERAAVPAQLRAVLQETLTSSWFNVTGFQEQTNTAWVPQRGTRPGDSCADLSFSYVMSSVLAGFWEEVHHVPPVLEQPDETTRTLPPITWVDDVAVLVEDASADGLLTKIGTVVTSMKKHTESHGLQLNFKQGKTEALIRFQGHGSSRAHREFREGGSKVQFTDSGGNEMNLLSTTKYGHLGALQTVAMTNHSEVAARIAKANTAFKTVKRKIPANEAIPMPRRCHMAQSLIFSRLVFGVEVWSSLHPKQEAKMNSFMYRVYRAIAKKITRNQEIHFSNLEVEAAVICVRVKAMIRLQRLRYFRKLGSEAPEVLIQLLDRDDREAEASWLDLIREDLEWMVHVHGQELHGARTEDIPSWWSFAKAYGKGWDKLVASLTAKEALQQHLQAKQKWATGKEQIAEVPHDEEHFDHRTCPSCGARFVGQMALSNHLWQKHKVHPIARPYVSGTSCGSCMRQFHTLQRIRQHLQYSETCLRHLKSVWHPEAVHEVETLICTQTTYRTPWHYVIGPKLPTRTQWKEAAPHKSFPDESETHIQECLLLCHDAARGAECRETQQIWQNLLY